MPKNTLKIGLVVDDGIDRLDGVQKYTVTIGNYFASLGHEVHYLCGQTTRTDIPNIHSLSRNVSIRSNGGNQLTIPLPASKMKIKKLLDKEKFDVLHVQTPYSPFLAGRIIKYAHGKTPIVGTFHILPFSIWQIAGSYFLGLLQTFSIKKVDTFWSVSAPAQTFAKRTFRINSSVLPNPVVIKDFKPKTPKKQNSKTARLVYLNRLVKRKGCMQLLEALSWAIDNNKVTGAIHLDICSDGYDRKRLEEYVATHNLEQNVTFHGYISDEEKATLLQQADIAVFPSLGGESFGIVLIEAIAAGAGAVIGGNNPGYASVLHREDTLFDPNNTEEFGGMIAELVANESKRAEIHEYQQKIIDDYDVAVVGDKLLETYQSLHKKQ